MDLRQLFLETGRGVLTWKQLRPYVTDTELVRAIASGAVVRDGRGIYRLAATPPEYAVAAQLRGVLSHLSAAQHWRLPVLGQPETTYVTVSRQRSRVESREALQVFYRDLPPDRVRNGVTDLRRTLIDCARDVPVPDALAVLDAALRTERISKAELVADTARLRGRRTGRARRVVGWADPRAASPLESALRGVLLDAGLASFKPQFAVVISTGELRHADLGDGAARLLIEAESLLFHGSTRVQLQRDIDRYNEFTAAGYRVLRFTWNHVMHRGDSLVQIVRRAHAAAVPAAGGVRPRAWA